MSELLPIETKNPLFGKYLYPLANDIREAQQDIGWTAQEVPVDKDRQDLKNNLSEAQLNLVTVTLQLFVEIEQKVGDVWNIISEWYPHSEIEACCAEICRMEKAVHAFFYQKVSEELHIDPETIAKNQQVIEVLKNKLDFIKIITSDMDKNKLLSLATVALIEQVFLFSNFAMFKSFQSNGNNNIKNTVTGVDFVVQDEQLHGDFAAYLFTTVKKETEKAKLSDYDPTELHKSIVNVLEEIIAHEDRVIDYTFAGETSINGITASQLKIFSRSRGNKTLELLGYDKLYTIGDNPIAEWFYRGSKSIKVHDFFAGITNQYRRSWRTESFSRLPLMEVENA